MYDAFFALETKFQIDAILIGVPQKFDEYLIKPRHYLFHAIPLLYGLIVSIWMFTTHNVGEQAYSGASYHMSDCLCFLISNNDIGVTQGAVCWIKDEFQLMLVSLIPVWLSLIVIIGCNASMLYNVFQSTTGSDGQLVVNLTVRTKCMIIRLATIPVFAILVWLPATILRVSKTFEMSLSNREALDYWWLCTFASSGLFNGILYVAMDGVVLSAWKNFLFGRGIDDGKNASSYNLSSSNGKSIVGSMFSSSMHSSHQSSRYGAESSRYSSEINHITMVDIVPANISRESLARLSDLNEFDGAAKGTEARNSISTTTTDMRDSTTFLPRRKIGAIVSSPNDGRLSDIGFGISSTRVSSTASTSSTSSSSSSSSATRRSQFFPYRNSVLTAAVKSVTDSVRPPMALQREQTTIAITGNSDGQGDGQVVDPASSTILVSSSNPSDSIHINSSSNTTIVVEQNPIVITHDVENPLQPQIQLPPPAVAVGTAMSSPNDHVIGLTVVNDDV